MSREYALLAQLPTYAPTTTHRVTHLLTCSYYLFTLPTTYVHTRSNVLLTRHLRTKAGLLLLLLLLVLPTAAVVTRRALRVGARPPPKMG